MDYRQMSIDALDIAIEVDQVISGKKNQVAKNRLDNFFRDLDKTDNYFSPVDKLLLKEFLDDLDRNRTEWSELESIFNNKMEKIKGFLLDIDQLSQKNKESLRDYFLSLSKACQKHDIKYGRFFGDCLIA